ncbi:MAG: gamma carbonic anhydrase family protein [Desulfobacterales bacterium]|nr:gamma carbonic anhydrase family protein [Desulfobacterales bacterium]MCP4162350.1 gamma carbonic anhydrase family protein [Deltaproteobacteria bacterium]
MPVYKLEKMVPEIESSVFIAETAQVIGDVKIGKKSSVWFGSVLRGDIEKITVGEGTNIQDLSVCHSDPGIPCIIGNNVTVGHRCIIHGCTISDNCLIGMGAIIMNGAKIGKGSIIAAGSVVLENQEIPPYSLVTGIPGKIKKTFDNKDEMEGVIKIPADVYQTRSVKYMDCLEKI